MAPKPGAHATDMAFDAPERLVAATPAAAGIRRWRKPGAPRWLEGDDHLLADIGVLPAELGAMRHDAEQSKPTLWSLIGRSCGRGGSRG